MSESASASASDVVLRSFQPDDAAALVELWRRCDLVRPQNNPHADIARKCAVDPAGLIVAAAAAGEGAILGSVMVGYEGHRGWINYLAVDPSRRRSGLGRRLMAAAEAYLREIGCPKINLQVRTTNRDVLAFYAAIGFLPDDVVSLGKRLIEDRGASG